MTKKKWGQKGTKLFTFIYLLNCNFHTYKHKHNNNNNTGNTKYIRDTSIIIREYGCRISAVGHEGYKVIPYSMQNPEGLPNITLLQYDGKHNIC